MATEVATWPRSDAIGPISRSFSDNSQKRRVTGKLQVRPSNLSNYMTGVC